MLDAKAVPADVMALLRALRGAGKQAWLAGGAVRDLLLGKSAQDFDVATDALPEEVVKLFPRVIPTGMQHGTVTVLTGQHNVEVTTFRGEGPYLDGRRPSAVTFLGDVDGDLARRDFTVNAMAWDPVDGALRDPFSGADDLRHCRLRAVGDPLARFREDGLRPLRAVRFACTLRLALDPATRRAIPATLEIFSKVAMERVREELIKLLLRGAPASRGLRLLLRTGLLARIIPELLDSVGFAESRFAGPRASRRRRVGQPGRSGSPLPEGDRPGCGVEGDRSRHPWRGRDAGTQDRTGSRSRRSPCAAARAGHR